MFTAQEIELGGGTAPLVDVLIGTASFTVTKQARASRGASSETLLYLP